MLLPFVIALAFVVKPDGQPKLITGDRSLCENEIWQSEAAHYTMCNEVMYVALNDNVRLPVIEIEIIASSDAILFSKRFKENRTMDIDLSEFARERATVRLKEVVRDSIVDEFKLAGRE